MGSKLLDPSLLRDLDLITLERLLLALMTMDALVEFQLLLVVGTEVADERVKVVEFALVL